MGLFDIFKSVSDYGIDAVITTRNRELQQLLDDGDFVEELIDLIDELRKTHMSKKDRPYDYPNDEALHLGFWDDNSGYGRLDFYEKLYPVFQKYLNWDLPTNLNHVQKETRFMDECLLPIISDYYQQIGRGYVIMVHEGIDRKFNGPVYLVWLYPEF